MAGRLCIATGTSHFEPMALGPEPVGPVRGRQVGERRLGEQHARSVPAGCHERMPALEDPRVHEARIGSPSAAFSIASQRSVVSVFP